MTHDAYIKEFQRRLGEISSVALFIYFALTLAGPISGRADDSLDAILRDSQALIQAGKLSAARERLEKGARAFPKEGNIQGLLGIVEAARGNYSAAESHFLKAVTLIPQFTAAYLNLGRLYQENTSQDPEALKKAADIYARLLKYEPANLQALYQASAVQLRLGSYRSSLDSLSLLPQNDQDQPQVLSIRCGALAGLGQSEKASEIVQKLLAHPQSTDLDVGETAQFLEASGHSQIAEDLLRGWTARAQDQGAAFHRLGLYLKRRERWSEARANLEKAAQFLPDNAPLLYELAQAAYGQKDYKGALSYLAHARDLEPQNAKIHFFWGMTCIKENLVKEAYEALKTAVSIEPENPDYVYAYGTASFVSEGPSSALAPLEKYRKLRPDDPRGNLALGASYFEAFDFEKAKAELQTAASFPETAAVAHYYLGRITSLSGDRNGAILELKQALEIKPNYPDALAELGATYVKIRDYDQAANYLHQAVALDPENYTANLNLLVLYQRTKDPRAPEQEKRHNQIREDMRNTWLEMLRAVEVEK